MAKDANKHDVRIRVELDPVERALLICGLRTMWSLHVESQVAVAARLSGSDRSLRETLEASDQRQLEIRALAARLGGTIFGD